MRKINLILANAAIAAALLLSSCKKDEDETEAAVGPTVNLLNVKKAGDIDPTFKDSEIAAGTKISFRVQATKGDKNLKTVGITLNGTTIGKADLTVDWKPATENPIKVSNNNVDITIDLTIPANATSSKYVITATDNDGVTASKAVTITEPVTTTDLATAQSFKWARVGGNAATGLDVFGLEWKSNGGTPTSAIVKKSAATKLVKLTDAYTSITTVEDLKAKVDAADEITQYSGVEATKNGTYNDVLGVKNGEKYFLINITEGKVLSTEDGTEVDITGTYKTEPTSKQEVKGDMLQQAQ